MNPNDPLETRLREISWRRKLTPAEEGELRAWLAAHPEARAAWAAERELNEFLAGMPEAPVSSNFTARVLHAVEREAAAEARRLNPKWSWRSFLPKTAVAAVALMAGVFAYQGYQ